MCMSPPCLCRSVCMSPRVCPRRYVPHRSVGGVNRFMKLLHKFAGGRGYCSCRGRGLSESPRLQGGLRNRLAIWPSSLSSGKAARNNPSVTLSPNIDLIGTLTVDCVKFVEFVGKVDEFPAFEAYVSINGNQTTGAKTRCWTSELQTEIFGGELVLEYGWIAERYDVQVHEFLIYFSYFSSPQ